MDFRLTANILRLAGTDFAGSFLSNLRLGREEWRKEGGKEGRSGGVKEGRSEGGKEGRREGMKE
ncbi:MAG: hypothetical protein QNJ51_17060 [Calothrix sp. MO_167.B12]|nr:hypothetical protein [Calothrix sp. MO_167.B12]